MIGEVLRDGLQGWLRVGLGWGVMEGVGGDGGEKFGDIGGVWVLERRGVYYKQYSYIFEMEEIQESSEEEAVFELDEVVWAKITGYPWWPAVIAATPTNRTSNYRVDFLTDKSHAFVARNKIAKYQHLRERFDTQKHMTKGLRKAIAAADVAAQLRCALSAEPQPSLAQVEVGGRQQKQLLQSPSIQEPLLQEKTEQQPTPATPLNPVPQQSQPPAIATLPQVAPSPHLLYSRDQRQKYVQALLKKYQLDCIPRLATLPDLPKAVIAREIPRKKVGCVKRAVEVKQKKIGKQPQEATISYLLARKINRLLKEKEELENGERKAISLSLAREVGQSGSREELLRLFKWIDISPHSTIAHFYHNWTSLQADKEKSSSMTVEEL